MLILGILILLAVSMAAGKRLYPNEDIVYYSGAGIIFVFSTLIVVGTFSYYAIGLTKPVVWFMSGGLILSGAILFRSVLAVVGDIRSFAREQVAWYRAHQKVEIAFAVFLALTITFFIVLARSPIFDAVRSPWDRVPWIAFFVFFLLALVGVLLLHCLKDNPSIKSSARIVAILFFTIISVGWIVFPIGQGFDSFIHQATEQLIANYGVVTPKPLYYIGQYSLVVFLSKFLFTSVVWIDKLLVPILAAFLIPWALFQWIKKIGNGQWAMGIGILILPFFLSQFTITTPQALANLFLVLLILGIERLTRGTSVLLATATLLIHPLAGIPAFIFLIGYWLIQKRKILSIFYFLFSIFLIPISFLLAAQFSSQIHVTFAPQNFLPWLQSIEWAGIYRENRFHAPFDILYFYAFNIKNIFWFFVVTGIVPLLRRVTQSGAPARAESRDEYVRGAERQDLERFTMIHIVMFSILFASYIIMAGFLSFEFLIGYEQADYANRVLEIAHLFLLPLFFVGFGWWVEKIFERIRATSPSPSPQRRGLGVRSVITAGVYATLALFMTASLYLTYPQNVDSYAVSHGFNTSAADIEAVRWIEANAAGEPYIVLSNQTVSAAAVREFGFKKYFGPQYFYPIPTGSPLYQDYLNMVYKKASRKTMMRAMDRVQVDRAYFVLNRYWVNFSQIKKEALASADASFSINDRVFIFTYDR